MKYSRIVFNIAWIRVRHAVIKEFYGVSKLFFICQVSLNLVYFIGKNFRE